MYLSIIFPAYNEEKRLPLTLEKTYHYLKKQKYTWEIIVVDDGSTDKTVKKVTELMKKIPNLSVIGNKKNHGKGYVVKQGMQKAKGEWRLFTDADNSTPIDQIEKLWKYKEEYPIIIGSRYIGKGSIKKGQPWYRKIISRASNILIQLLAVRGIEDTQCGFKLFKGEVADKIFPHQTIMRWAFDIEILGLAQKSKIPIKEVSVDWYNSAESKVRAVRALFRSFVELIRIWRHLKKFRPDS